MDLKKSNQKNKELDSKLVISSATLFLIAMFLYEDKVTKFIRIASKFSWVGIAFIVATLLLDACFKGETKEEKKSKSTEKINIFNK